MTARIRHVVALAWAVTLLLVGGSASAWVETHVTADDVRIEVERSGSAVVDHAITMQIKGGPLRAFDLVNTDRDAAPLTDGSVIPARPDGLLALPIPLDVAPRPDGALRVGVDHPKGVSRGVFLFHVRYRTNLLTSGAITRDGAMMRIRWVGPTWTEGIDGMRCTFALPAAPTPPRSAVGGANLIGEDRPENEGTDDPGSGASEDGAFLTQVRRRPDADEIELTRPHVARGEGVAWTIRVDPKALLEVDDPRLRTPEAEREEELVSPSRRALYGAAAAMAMVLVSVLAGFKARQVARHAHRAGVAPRPLLPIGAAPRTVLAGPLLVAGVALQGILQNPLAGTALVLLAMGLMTYLPPLFRPKPRGPGQWFPLSDGEAFARALPGSDTWLDAGTPVGRWIFGAWLVVGAGFSYGVLRTSSYYGSIAAFDLAALVPLFCTGRLGQLPPHPMQGSAPTLGALARALRTDVSLRALAWARLPDGSREFDELRILVAPRVPRRGFSGIEVGLACVSGGGGFLKLPEVLVRVVEGTPAHEAFQQLLSGRRWLRGRKPDERVVALSPRLPTRAMTLSLARRLAEHAREPLPMPAALVSAGVQPVFSKSRSSRGNSERTSNGGTVASPGHFTNAACRL